MTTATITETAPTTTVSLESVNDEGDQQLLQDLADARQSGDVAAIKAAEHAVVLRFLPVANAVARRYRSRGVSIDDLQQQARLGLVQAVSRWQPGLGAAFLVFALPTMQGTIKRYFRDTITTVRRPRSAQENGPRIASSLDQLSHRSGRPPADAELAAHAGVTIEQLREFRLTTITCNPLPLDNLLLAEYAGGGPDPQLSRVESRRDLAEAWTTLTEREKVVLALRFWEELSQAEIGQVIGVTQTHIGRILRRACAKLGEQLNLAG